MKPFALFLVFISNLSFAQQAIEEKETAYQRTIQERSAKIVKVLDIKDTTKVVAVTNIIAQQYKNLRRLHDRHDEALNDSLSALHKLFLARLFVLDLDENQISAIKNGMTYNVMNITYKAYNDMIPVLNFEQKTQIMSYLIEARELAMDAESSDKKHAVFGKFKGKINNYLSAQGIDSQKFRREWEERLKKEKTK